MSPAGPDLSEEMEEFWRDIRVRMVEITPEAPGPESVIDRATERTLKILREPLLAKFSGERLEDPDTLIGILALAMQTYTQVLLEEQQKRDVTSVIQVFLESTELAPEDAKDFLRSLPRAMINRILTRLEGQPHSGLQALLSIEALWRDRSLDRDYEVRRDPNGKLVVTIYPREEPGGLRFFLRELLGDRNR